MMLESRRAGKFGKHISYVIRSDDGSEIAYFGSLEKASLVFRYLLGLEMDESERLTANMWIREFDEKN